MKKTQLALAAVALVASSAAMAEVTVSGRIDAGIQSGRSGAVIDGTSTSRGLTGGLLAPNFLTFAGSEDIGGGMKALFVASSTFSSVGGLPGDNGGLSGLTFLQSHVGLAGDFGTLKIGQTVDSFWGNGVANFDVTGGGNMGSAVTTLFMHGASGVFHSNTVQYVTPSIGGVNAAATYILNDGVSARGSAALKTGDYSLAGTTDIGSVKVGAGYSKLNTNTSYFLGAGTDLGFAKVNLLYVNSNAAQGVAGDKAATTGLNTAIPLVGALSATAGYYTTNGSAINGTNTSIGLLYSLSKRTTVFGNYEKATGNTLLGYGALGGGQGTAGSILTAGIAHSF